MKPVAVGDCDAASFSALQRAEIAEIPREVARREDSRGFSALQRAEIAEISNSRRWRVIR